MVAMYPPDEFEARNEGISLKGYRRRFSIKLNRPEKGTRSIHRYRGHCPRREAFAKCAIRSCLKLCQCHTLTKRACPSVKKVKLPVLKQKWKDGVNQNRGWIAYEVSDR